MTTKSNKPLTDREKLRIGLQRALNEYTEPRVTRRDRFIMAAMAGLLASWPEHARYNPTALASTAREFADATLAEAERTKP